MYITATQMPSALIWMEVSHVLVILALKEMESLVQVSTKIADLHHQVLCFYFVLFVFPDTDECVQSGTVCHTNALCNDTDGGFVCQCLPGFTGDGNTTCDS